jgi:hypothetical protein
MREAFRPERNAGILHSVQNDNFRQQVMMPCDETQEEKPHV